MLWHPSLSEAAGDEIHALLERSAVGSGSAGHPLRRRLGHAGAARARGAFTCSRAAGPMMDLIADLCRRRPLRARHRRLRGVWRRHGGGRQRRRRPAASPSKGANPAGCSAPAFRSGSGLPVHQCRRVPHPSGLGRRRPSFSSRSAGLTERRSRRLRPAALLCRSPRASRLPAQRIL